MRFKVEFELGKTKKPERKSDLVQYDDNSNAYYLGLPSLGPARLRSYVEAYKISEIVRACITKINLAAKSVPWYLYQRRGKDTIEIESHPLLDLLRRPSKTQSWSKFLERALGFYLISGNRYLRKYVGSFGGYGEMEVLASHRVRIKADQFGRIAHYEYYRHRQWESVPAEEVLHTAMFNPADEPEGLSPITTIASQIDISRLAAEWSIKLLQNDARPGAIAFIPGTLTEEQRAQIREQWNKDFKGLENAGGLLILEGGSGSVRAGDLKLMSYAPRELDFGESEKRITRKCAVIFHVPPELLGDAENKTYSNQKEARKALYQEATLPLLDELRDDLNGWIVPTYKDSENMFFDYDASDVDALSADTNEVWDRVGAAVDRGVLTRNQALEIMGYGKSKEPGADALTVSTAVLPLEAVVAGVPGGE